MSIAIDRSRAWSRLASIILSALVASSASAATGDGAPVFKKSASLDKRAFEAARATEDARAKVAALRAFEAAYPDSQLVERAEWEIFSVLTKRLPQQRADVRQQARKLVKHSHDGIDGVLTRAEVANALAYAGVDLDDAEGWAKEAVVSLSEPAFLRWSQPAAKPTKADPAAQADVHREFAEYRSDVLAALANVYLREGKTDQAAGALSQAALLDPDNDEVNALQGEIALSGHHDAAALDAFERAQVAGALQPGQRAQMFALYRKAHGGTLDGFEESLDARYEHMFPSPIPSVKKAATAGNRTVLVELFTGAGCPPCTAADLALEALQGNYSRRQVVVLAFDQHIPRPDPLAIPDGIARGKWYGIAGTPTFYIDGQAAKVVGGGRASAPAAYAQAARQVDARLAVPAPLALQATARLKDGGTIEAEASIKPGGAETSADHAAVVGFALVENHVRYSGENGVRFHEAVVRAWSAAPASSGPGHAVFDLSGIEARQRGYLDGYEQHNDRYGPIHFLSKDTHLDRAKLAVVVYAQDPATKAILQSAFVPITGL